MLIVTNRGYKRKYVYGGYGIFDSIVNFLRGLLTQAGKHAASAALDAGKSAAETAGRKLVEKAVNKLITPDPEEIKRKARDIITKYVESGTGDIQDLVRKLNGGGLKVV